MKLHSLLLAASAFLFVVAPDLDAQEFFTLKGHGGPIKGVAAGADGAIVTASFDNSVGLWRDGRVQWLEGHEAAVNAVAYTGDGRVISGGDDFVLRLWDGRTGVPRVLGRHLGKIVRIAVSASSQHVASASWDGTARIWSLGDDAAPVEIAGHDGGVNDVAFSPDGARLYTASMDGTLRVWDTRTGAFLRTLARHGFGINALVLAADESWIAYGAVDGGTRVLSLPDARELSDLTLDRRPILAMAHHPASGRIAVGDAHGYIMMVDAGSWQIVNDFRATLSGPIWALAFSPDGQNLHAGGLDDALYSWPVAGLRDAPPMADTERSFLTRPEEMSNGERQYQRKCSICHALGPDRERRAGPTLYRIFGRAAGEMEDYSYSDTLANSDIVWDEDTIDLLFEQGPDHYIPGSKMPMQRITTASDRSDLIAFLKQSTMTPPSR